MTELIGIREASRRLGVSDTAVHKAIKTGRITPPLDDDKHPDNGRPRLRWPQCRDEWNANSNASKRTHVGRRGERAEVPSEDLGGVGPSNPELEQANEPQPPRQDRSAGVTTWMEPQPGGGALMRSRAPDPEPLQLDENGDPVITNSMSLADAQRVKAILAGRQALLDLKRDRGQLVDREKVRLEAFKAARGARDALQTMEDRLAPILASLTDLQEVRKVLREDIRRVCERIAAGAEKL